MQPTADVVQDVLLSGAISLDSKGQKDEAFFYEKKHSCLVTLAFQKPKESPFNNKKNPDMIYLLTNVAKTQDVPLDGTIFFRNSGQKDKLTFMNRNITIELS